MELKTLKIDSDLHEKLKELADDKNTSMQNLIEKKLTELISHEDDILFNVDKIKYDAQFQKYNLEMSEESFNKLINFFEIFLTNRNLKNVKEIENLLQVITKLKCYEADKKYVKQDVKESILKNFTKEEGLVDMISKAKQSSVPFEKTDEGKNFDYSNIEKGYTNSLTSLLTQLDSVRFSMAKKDLSEKYETLNGHSFLKTTQDAYNKQKDEYFEIVEMTMRKNNMKNNYLNEGDVVKDPKTDLEYVIHKIYNSDSLFEEPSYILKGVTVKQDAWMGQFTEDTKKIDSDMIVEVEKLYSKAQLINHNFLLGDKLLLEVIDTIDFEYEKNVSKLLQVKKAAYDLKQELIKYKEDKSIISNNEIDEKILSIEKSISEELDYETMKSSWIKTKVWFEEFKIRA
jgi:hypothetical protein